MKNFRIVFLILSLSVWVGIASAQPSFIYESSPATRTDKMATSALTDSSGKVQVSPGTGATSLGKAIDNASGGTDTGVACLTIRDDSGAAKSSANGDYQGLYTNSKGALRVEIRSGWETDGATSLVKSEDYSASDGNAGVGSLFVSQDPLSQDQGATNRYGFGKIDRVGRTITTLAPAGESWQSCSSSNTGTSDVAIKAAVASNRIYVTSISCYNTAAVDSAITFKDGSTAMFVGAIAKQATNGGGFSVGLSVPLRGSVNTAFNFAMTTTATATTCCAAGYISVY